MAIQVSGTLLDACVLAFLAEKDAYGYSLTQLVKESLDISESTLYPVMRRLQNDELLTTYDEPHSGRNRRYYRLTEKGADRFRACVEEWKVFKGKVEKILGGDAS
ncbi:MAG: PadR family transcriptional regulator [Oscillospiraceae bacterium]|nr:PadR family transcriptional regulator [Oscillospiraceae bacterium]